MSTSNRRPLVAGAVVLANVIAGFGTFLCWAAYASGDPSGLQYMFLWIGGAFAALGAILLLFVRAEYPVPLANFATLGATLLLAILPQITGAGYNGSVLDRPGTTLSLIVLGAHALITVYSAARAVRIAA